MSYSRSVLEIGYSTGGGSFMSHILKLTDWKWNPGSQTEMMYKDSFNEWFVGKRHDVAIGTTYVVEVSSGTQKDGYRHIVRFKTVA